MGVAQQTDLLKIIRDSLERLNQDIDSLKASYDLLQIKYDSCLKHCPLKNSVSDIFLKILQTESSAGGGLWWQILLGIALVVVIWLLWKLTKPSRVEKKKPVWLFVTLIAIIALIAAIYFVFSFFNILVGSAVGGIIILILYKTICQRKKNKMINKKDFGVDYEDDHSSFSSTRKDTDPIAVDDVPCIAAVCSDTRKSKNQDSFCEAYVKDAKARIIAVADGVGSSFKAEQGSRTVAAKAVELVKNAIESNAKVKFNSAFDKIQIDFDSIFDQVQSALDAEVEGELTNEHELLKLKQASFGTTLIVGVDFPDRFVAAYVGNGSIWHLSGLFNSFPPAMCLPWNAVNLLNPDTSMKEGREALYKIFFYKGEKKHHKPTVLQVSKLREDPGDMFIITTDGVYSADHAIAGKDDEGEIWVPSTAQFGLLCDYLKQYVESADDINDTTLKDAINRYLAHINEAKIMDDDTTLGVFISQEARKHFFENRKVNEAN